MLFLQGTRDALADTQTLEKLLERLGTRATLKLFQDVDHSFHVPVRTGRSDAEVRAEMLDTLASWLQSVTCIRAARQRLWKMRVEGKRPNGNLQQIRDACRLKLRLSRRRYRANCRA
jgi:hypothetical protein